MEAEGDSSHPANAPGPGSDAGEVIRRHIETLFADAEQKAKAIEGNAVERGRRRAAAYEAAAREKADREALHVLEEAKSRAGAIVQAAEEQAAEARRRSREEISRSQEKAVQEAQRSAERARARLLKFADAAEHELSALLTGLRRDAGEAPDATSPRRRRSG